MLEKISFKEYQSRKGINQSSIKKILDDPNKYALGIDTTKKTEAMDFGSLCHDILLSPTELSEKYLFSKFDVLDFRKKEHKEEKAQADKLGLILVDTQTFNMAKELLFANEGMLKEFFSKDDGGCELSLFDKMDGIDCKARFDYISNDGTMICDLKIMKSSRKYDFMQSVAKYGYYIQAAFYLGLSKAKNFYFIVVEKEPPYMLGVYELDITAIDLGNQKIKEAFDIIKNIDRYRENFYFELAENEYHRNVVQNITLPAWAFYQN